MTRMYKYSHGEFFFVKLCGCWCHDIYKHCGCTCTEEGLVTDMEVERIKGVIGDD